MRTLTLLAALLLAACDPFTAAQNADTIEAYEAFIAENPTSPWVLQAEARLEQLYLAKAREEATLEAYDAWLERYPRGTARAEVLAEREAFLWAWAVDQGTVAAMERFLEEYPSSTKRAEAQKTARILTHQDHIRIDSPRVSRINLAEDPEGPLNGWLLEVDVTNTGDTPLSHLVLSVTAPGTDLASEWPVAALSWGMPLPEELKTPLRPGQTRTWSYTTGRPPETWDGSFETAIADVRVAR